MCFYKYLSNKNNTIKLHCVVYIFFKKTLNMTVKGLYLYKDYVSEEQEDALLEYIDDQEWNTSLERLTQHYGFEYNYLTRTAVKPTTPIPEEFEYLQESIMDELCKIRKSENSSFDFNQAIVNRYQPNQGIGKHIDSLVFGSAIVSLSLGSDTIMKFRRGNKDVDVLLPRRSIVFLLGASRYYWSHEISRNVSYRYGGKIHENGIRTSITFRHYPIKT